jgi:hypothetical protein
MILGVRSSGRGLMDSPVRPKQINFHPGASSGAIAS